VVCPRLLTVCSTGSATCASKAVPSSARKAQSSRETGPCREEYALMRKRGPNLEVAKRLHWWTPSGRTTVAWP
jgi:hypothetical protein